MRMSGQSEEPNKPVEPESILPIDEHVEETQEADGRKVRHRGIYLLPNLFTTANLFAGFFSIITAINGNFMWPRRRSLSRWCLIVWTDVLRA